MQNDRQPLLADLIARVAQADRRAFDTLYESSSARLNALCLSILKDRREAEEVLEEAFIAIWKEASGHADSGLSPMAWLTTQTRDRAIARRAALAGGATPGGRGDAMGLLQAAYLEGLDYAQLGYRHGLTPDEARHGLHEELEHLSGHATDEGDSFAAAEQALGLRPRSDGANALQVAEWQEKLSLLAGDLTPVMAPARARQRIRESLGHGAAPLSIDPLERTPWWRGSLGIATLLLIAALAWYFWPR